MIKQLIFFILLVSYCHASNVLNALGTMAGQNVYLTYAAIGSTADGYINGSYSAEEAAGLMDTYQGFSEQAAQLLTELATSKDLKPEEKVTVMELKKTYLVLQKQAAEFKKYITLGDQAFIDGYEVNRSVAWKRISRLLQIKE